MALAPIFGSAIDFAQLCLIERHAHQHRVALFAADFGAAFDLFDLAFQLLGRIGGQEERDRQFVLRLRAAALAMWPIRFSGISTSSSQSLVGIGDFEQILAAIHRAGSSKRSSHVPRDDAAVDRAADLELLFLLVEQLELLLQALRRFPVSCVDFAFLLALVRLRSARRCRSSSRFGGVELGLVLSQFAVRRDSISFSRSRLSLHDQHVALLHQVVVLDVHFLHFAVDFGPHVLANLRPQLGRRLRA